MNPTTNQLKRRARAAGVRPGNGGGWLYAHNLGSVQGWDALRHAAQQRIALATRTGRMPQGLSEVLDGSRIGVPTLSVKDPLALAVGLLAPSRISWRDIPSPPMLRDEDD